MANRAIIDRFNSLNVTIGEAGLNAAFPVDFEYYFTALELVDSLGNTIDYLAFPVQPSSITKVMPKRTNIKKSSSGITVIRSNSFVPEMITIKGNFGRSFKLLVSPDKYEQGSIFSVTSGVYTLQDGNVNSLSINYPIFNVGVKTGYGCTKILQAIISKSSSVDRNGRPFRLLFYNLGLGESYLVEVPPNGLTLMQDESMNMIWTYSLELTVLAPIQLVSAGVSPSSSRTLLTTSVIQNAFSTLRGDISNLL